MSFISPRLILNGPGNGALLDPNTGYLNVAETGTVASK